MRPIDAPPPRRGYFNGAVLHKCAVPKGTLFLCSPEQKNVQSRVPKNGLACLCGSASRDGSNIFHLHPPPPVVSSGRSGSMG